MAVVVTRRSAPPTKIDVVHSGDDCLTFSTASGRYLRARMTVRDGGENYVEIPPGEARALGRALIEWADSQS